MHPETRHAAKLVLESYDRYFQRFRGISHIARRRFENRNWTGRHSDSLQRVALYEQSVEDVARLLEECIGSAVRKVYFWQGVKQRFLLLTVTRENRELILTYYNSITRNLLNTTGINRSVEWVELADGATRIRDESSACDEYSHSEHSNDMLRSILLAARFTSAFAHLDEDATLTASEIDLYAWPHVGYRGTYSIEMLRRPMFRNKAAYLVGRVIVSDGVLPLVIVLFHGDRGLYVDAVLMDQEDVSVVFSYAHSAFHVDADCYHSLVSFLQSILPQKPVADIYNSLGFPRHGKTEFYRHLHRHVHDSEQEFVIAPGKEGAVMIAFTLPDFDYVVKIIKDHPCFMRSMQIPPKNASIAHVRQQYSFVAERDRVGRIVESLEFEFLRFRTRRFSEQLLDEFSQAAHRAVEIGTEYIVIRHQYIQRKVIPLPMYLTMEKDPEAIRHIVIDFGYFLKDMAGAGLFPSDLFNIWNYGVTRRRRVVTFDYDDIIPLEQAKFRIKPQPRSEDEILEPEEDWITTSPNDFFIDEMERYSGVPLPLRGVFGTVHSDLFTEKFWNELQEKVASGDIADTKPYPPSRRLRARIGMQPAMELYPR